MAKTDLKDLIVAYRSQGLQYKEIAAKLGVDVEYARSVYSRAVRTLNTEDSPYSDNTCKRCGKPLQHTEGKKKKQFCCSECRDHYFNEQKRRKPYVLVCEHCGNEFVAYGNPTKRFCSRECRTLAGRKG